jgi:hypothetical protein
LDEQLLCQSSLFREKLVFLQVAHDTRTDWV